MNRITLFRTYLILVAFLVTMVANRVMADSLQSNNTINRQINRSFHVDPNATLFLNNESGSITCKNWDKQEVSIEITISVLNMSGKEASRILDKVSVSFSDDSESVKVKTLIPSDLEIKGKLAVDYIVWMPESLKLHLLNKLGDVYIDERKAECHIEVDYGNVLIGTLDHGNNLINVRFGTAKIESMKGAVIQAYFGKISVVYAGSIKLQAQHTDTDISKVVVFDGDYDGGQLMLAKASVVKLNTMNAGVQIDSLLQKFTLYNELGFIHVGYVDPDFKSISVFNEFGSISIPMSHISGFHIDAYSELGSLQLPDKNEHYTEFSMNGETIMIKGVLGENPLGSVKLICEQGSIDLK